MAKKRTRLEQGVELIPTDLSSSDLSREGELAYDSDSDRLKYRNASATQEVVDTDSTQTLENKTIDATSATGNNTLTADSDDILYDNATSGLTATNVKAAIDELKVGLDNQDQATEISYDNSTSGLTATNVKAALDEIDSNLEAHIADAVDAHDATAISYDNTTSGLSATETQAAIDEVEGRVDTAETNISNHINDATDAHDASAISYVNATSGLAATDAQAAIDEVDSDLDTHIADTSVHGVAGAVVGTTDSQSLSNKRLTTNTIIDNVLEYTYETVAITGDATISVVRPVVRLVTGGSPTGISGIANFSNDSDRVTLINKTGVDILVKNEDATAVAAYRILTGTADDIQLKVDASIILQYNPSESRWHIVGGVGGAGGSTSFEINQTAHGFSVGDGIYHNGTSWVAGQANAESTLAYYVVTEVIDADNFVAGDFGRLEVPAHGFTVGEYYFLSASVAGQPTSTEPGTGFSNPLFFVEDANTLQIKVYRPSVIGSDINLDELSDVSASTPSDGDVIAYNSGSGLYELVSRGVRSTATIANNQSSAANVTGLLLDGASHKGYKVAYNIYRDTDSTELSQTGTLHFAYKPDAGTWQFSDTFAGDDAGVTFSVTALGQVQYTSSNIAGTGYVGEMVFRIEEEL